MHKKYRMIDGTHRVKLAKNDEVIRIMTEIVCGDGEGLAKEMSLLHPGEKCAVVIYDIKSPILLGKYVNSIIHVSLYASTGDESEPMSPYYAELLLNECLSHNIPFQFAGWGDWEPVTALTAARYHLECEHKTVDGVEMFRVGAHRSHRILAGREWDERVDFYKFSEPTIFSCK